MTWELGTVATLKLKEELVAFIETLRPQFPGGRHISVYAVRGGDKRPGTQIELYAQADEQRPHQFLDAESGNTIFEEYHRIVVDVKADDKSGGAPVAESIFAVLKRNFGSTIGREILISMGICNVREAADAPIIEEVTFERPLVLTCSTEVFLN
jgi:hypothetical protein